ncbi:MAG: hypothetical protein JWM64_2510 [Frankiales bacterium]|nr:hypothetical protein [Frankiales bacterium]
MRPRPFPPTRRALVDPGTVVAGAVATAAVGYGIALWLARVGTWAERVEEEQYCGPPAPAQRRRPGAARPLHRSGAPS